MISHIINLTSAMSSLYNVEVEMRYIQIGGRISKKEVELNRGDMVPS